MPLTSQPRTRNFLPNCSPRAPAVLWQDVQSDSNGRAARRTPPLIDGDQVVDHGGGFDPADIQTEFAQRVLLQLEFAQSLPSLSCVGPLCHSFTTSNLAI